MTHRDTIPDQLTLLVMVGDQDLRTLLGKMLKTLCSKVLLCEEADEAFRLAVAERPDVILATANGHDDGVRLCRSVRQHAALNTVPVVIMTTSRDRNKFTVYFESGCDQILPIPFRTNGLFAAIDKALERDRLLDAGQIPVYYRTGTTDYVDATVLDRLIYDNQLLGFRRADGLAVIGRDPIRNGRQISYAGPERRRDAVAG